MKKENGFMDKEFNLKYCDVISNPQFKLFGMGAKEILEMKGLYIHSIGSA